VSETPRLPVVIVLNGVSSVGKSSIARAIQQVAQRDFLHVSLDAFLAMLPPRSFGGRNGLTFSPVYDAGGPSLAVEMGSLLTRTLSGMRGSIAALARAGNDVIVDDIMFDLDIADDYHALLTDCMLRFVGVHAPLAVIEQRERTRGDRDIGLARWQFSRIHARQHYDLEVDTNALDPDGAARQICAAFDL
jgi:chloramphenicol 3-O phosphotransferase